MLSFLTFGSEAKVLGRRNAVEENYDRSREGRGLEDTDTGICQTNGMEPNNLNISDVTVVSEVLRSPSEDQHHNENQTLVQINIFWPKLVGRKVCVDRLNVSLNGDEEVLLYPDPADFEGITEQVSIVKDPCQSSNERLRVMLLNLRSAKVGLEVTDKNKNERNQVKIVSGILNLQAFCPSSEKFGNKFLIENIDSVVNENFDDSPIIFTEDIESTTSTTLNDNLTQDELQAPKKEEDNDNSLVIIAGGSAAGVLVIVIIVVIVVVIIRNNRQKKEYSVAMVHNSNKKDTSSVIENPKRAKNSLKQSS